MIKNLKTALNNYRRKRNTIAELSRLSDRELKDLGICRSDIHAVANGI